jgi:hypothetical protein
LRNIGTKAIKAGGDPADPAAPTGIPVAVSRRRGPEDQ